ncbi:hypothetical protein D3C72_2009930 [compost metagenome]
MREQGVALEHGIDRPAEGRQALHGLAVEADGAGAGLLEAGDEPQQGGLAAAGRAEKGEELVGADFQGNIVEGLHALPRITELHAHTVDADRAGHADHKL